MNNKQLKKLLRNKAEEITLENKSEQILQQVNYNAKYNNNQKATAIAIPRKNLTYYIMVAVAVCLLAIAIPIGIIFGVKTPIGTGGLVVGQAEQIFSREVLALGNVVASDTFEQGVENYTSNSKIIEYEKIANDVNHYLTTGEALILKNNIKVDYRENTNKDYSEYKYVMNIKYLDKSASNIDYAVFFNKTEKPNKIEVVGVCKIEGVDYRIKGEQHTRGKEIESELIIYLGFNSYISIENETEYNENEYEFEYVVDDIVVRGVSLEVEMENGVNKTEIEITENDVETAYEFEYKTDNLVECSYEVERIKQKISIKVFPTYYEYQFKDGTIIKINRTDNSKNASENQAIMGIIKNFY